MANGANRDQKPTYMDLFSVQKQDISSGSARLGSKCFFFFFFFLFFFVVRFDCFMTSLIHARNKPQCQEIYLQTHSSSEDSDKSDQNHWAQFWYPRMQIFFIRTKETLIRLHECICHKVRFLMLRLKCPSLVTAWYAKWSEHALFA